MEAMMVIRRVLKRFAVLKFYCCEDHTIASRGGSWINVGPLLYHPHSTILLDEEEVMEVRGRGSRRRRAGVGLPLRSKGEGFR
eukprot:768166-Hanusia_phi.AAC.1